MIGATTQGVFEAIPPKSYDVVRVSDDGDQVVLAGGVQYADAIRIYCRDYHTSKWKTHFLVLQTHAPQK